MKYLISKMADLVLTILKYSPFILLAMIAVIGVYVFWTGTDFNLYAAIGL